MVQRLLQLPFRATVVVPALLLLLLLPSSVDAFCASAVVPPSYTDIVVMGVGDLRTVDHGGLTAASTAGASPAVAILLTDDTLQHLPHVRSHTSNTVQLVQRACTAVVESLGSSSSSSSSIPVHIVTDLADLPVATERYHVWHEPMMSQRGFEYTAYRQLLEHTTSTTTTSDKVVPWSAALRPSFDKVPDRYPDYVQQCVRNRPAETPLPAVDRGNTEQPSTTKVPVVVPNTSELLDRVVRLLDLDPSTVEASANTGLYGTHWADATLPLDVDAIVSSQEGDCSNKKNSHSLEHVTMEWQQETSWWLPDEQLTRNLAAPLWLGTTSLRQVVQYPQLPTELAELREWHQHLAASQGSGDNSSSSDGDNAMRYGYWYYQGFLSRYMERKAIKKSSDDKAPALVLVHGFGASAAQWTKCIQSIGDDVHCIAPDLLGFGHAEKPGVSYTSYLWESNIQDFVRERLFDKAYCVGGNSIGGYCSMALAANEAAAVGAASNTASGAPGTGQCQGLILLNSAGVILNREEVADKTTSQSVATQTMTGTIGPCKPPPRPLVRLIGNGLLGYLRPNIQSICKNVYPVHPEAVDDVLCENIERDSLDPGAINVMMAGTKLPPPRTANELLGAEFGNDNAAAAAAFTGPVLVTQGVLDPLNNAPDRLERLGALREGVTKVPLQAGHCPHDEVPEQVAESITTWMQSHQLMARQPVAATAASVMGK